MSAITQAESELAVGLFVFIGGLIALYVQNRRGIAAQRGDHAATAEMVREVRDDLREVKADVRDVKDEVRSHGDRLRNLEHWNAVQDDNTHTIEELDRLRSEIRQRKEAS